MSSNGRLLEVEDLVVHYPVPRGLVGTVSRRPRQLVRAVDGVSFSLARGELLALVGESGCGKTTTAQTVLRLVEPAGGRIAFDGRDITSATNRVMRPLRRRMQIIYQDPYESLDPRLTVRGTVEEPLLIHREGGSKQQRAELVRDALVRVELTPPELFLGRYPHELSGGQRQRVAIAASIVLGPELLVADEPVSMLDVSVRAGVLGLLDPVGGRISFDGQDITALPNRSLRPLRRRMQIIYQDPYESLDPRLRVRQTVEEPLLVHRVAGSKRDRADRIREALERVELHPADLFLDRYPHELSGGQRQRVAIAASLVLEPRLLVADEPVSMLDVSVRAGILRLLDGLREGGLGILMITHDLSTAARFSDRIAVMYLGRIVEEGAAREVVSNPQHPYTKALLSVVPKRDPRERTQPQILRGEPPDAVRIPPGCRFHPRCPIAIDVCREQDPPLERPKEATAPDHTAACLLA